jgi:hypothetical protein
LDPRKAEAEFQDSYRQTHVDSEVPQEIMKVIERVGFLDDRVCFIEAFEQPCPYLEAAIGSNNFLDREIIGTGRRGTLQASYSEV